MSRRDRIVYEPHTDTCQEKWSRDNNWPLDERITDPSEGQPSDIDGDSVERMEPRSCCSHAPQAGEHRTQHLTACACN